MSMRSPHTTKVERGAYSAGIYKEGDTVVAEDSVGTVIKEGTAAISIQAAVDAARNVFFADGTYDIGSTTITLPDKSMNLHGAGIDSIIKGSADPLIDVTMTSEYQLKMYRLGVHTTSSNKGIFIDNCTSRLPLWLSNVHFVPEGHAGTLLYIKGLSNAQITNCSFQEPAGQATTAKGIYLTADGVIFSQEMYLNACSFYHLNYGIQGYALPANRDHLAGLHMAGSIFFQNDYPLHFQNADDITIIGCSVESPLAGAEKGIILHDTYEGRIVGNRLSTRTTGGQIELIGETLDSYRHTIAANYLKSYDKVGDGILLDSSPGNKFTEAIIRGNTLDYMINAVKATKGTTFYPQIIFMGNHVWDCTWNITGDINHSIIVGNVWGASCSSTVVNGTFGTSEIAHNHKA